jgi:hypothetical protein
MMDVLSRMPNLIEENEIRDQTTDAPLFLLQPLWLLGISKYVTIGKFMV